MDNLTYMDELVNIPAKIIARLSDDKDIVGFVLDKQSDMISDDDKDKFIDNNIFDYQYIDGTAMESGVYMWVEVEVLRVENRRIKSAEVYVTIACHKSYMKLDGKKFVGIIGNRRDNIVRFVDKSLNFFDGIGIGQLSLKSVRTMPTVNSFTIRELTYSIPEFNYKTLNEA